MDWVFVQPGRQARLQPEMVQKKTCGKNKSKMFWATFGFGRRNALIPMEGDIESPNGGVTARVYKAVLVGNLLPILQYGAIFMQDNAQIHKALIVRQWFKDNKVNVMEWPPYSPDLNPIENLWALLKAEIYKTHPELIGISNTQASLDLLVECAIATWKAMPEELLTKLVDTMVNRVAAVIQADGWYTKY